MQSIDSGSDSGSTNIEDILEQEPMYFVLGKFLETADGKNIATILQELIVEMKKLRETVAALKPLASEAVPATIPAEEKEKDANA